MSTRVVTIDEKQLQIKKKNNVRLYSLYRIFAWDLFFYYAISYLFFTLEKGISPAEVLLLDAIYRFFKMAAQIPCTLLIQKMGKRKSLILANFITALHILIIIIAPNFAILIVSQALCAIAYIIKGTCESDMLYDSLPHGDKRSSEFSKIEGKANSKYYYLDAVCAVLSSFLFVVNHYIPMILCLIILMIAFILSLKFEEIHEEKGKMQIKSEIKRLRVSFRNIFRSKRLKYLLLINGVIVSLFRILQNLRNTSLTEIGMPEQYFGVIFAAMGIISGIAAKNGWRIHKRYRNKTLAFLSLPVAISCLLIGVVLICGFSTNINIIILLILFAIQYIMSGPYSGLIKQYFNNFTNSEKRVKIATANNLIENAMACVMVFVASWILDFVSIELTMVIIGCIFILVLTLMLDKMREKVGLKPDEYGKKEIL